MIIAKAICFTFDVQEIRLAFSFALARAGSSMLARMAMIAITTSSSMSVKAEDRRGGRGRPSRCVEEEKMNGLGVIVLAFFGG
jgi:hypothetical protein